MRQVILNHRKGNVMKVLASYEFKATVAKATYDWAKLLDGGIYQVTKGDDFECKTSTFAMMSRMRAKKLGKTVRISKVDDDTLVIQAVPAAVVKTPESPVVEETVTETEKRPAGKKSRKGTEK